MKKLSQIKKMLTFSRRTSTVNLVNPQIEAIEAAMSAINIDAEKALEDSGNYAAPPEAWNEVVSLGAQYFYEFNNKSRKSDQHKILRNLREASTTLKDSFSTEKGQEALTEINQLIKIIDDEMGGKGPAIKNK